MRNNKVDIIANNQGNRTTPSYVAFTDSERLVGEAAKNQAAMNPKNTVFDAKRLIGRQFNDRAVQNDLKLLSFKVWYPAAPLACCRVSNWPDHLRTLASWDCRSLRRRASR